MQYVYILIGIIVYSALTLSLSYKIKWKLMLIICIIGVIYFIKESINNLFSDNFKIPFDWALVALGGIPSILLGKRSRNEYLDMLTDLTNKIDIDKYKEIKNRVSQKTNGGITQTLLGKCPYCRKEVSRLASKCPYCISDL